ncbi:MAG: S8 family serine peptidase [Phycisphaerales bacterium]|nr:S8 family serine peptidase [Phycisphaerales bacterium]
MNHSAYRNLVFRRVTAWLVGALVVSTAAAADDPVFYSGGKAHRLNRSTTELVVTTMPQFARDARVAINADPQCAVEPIPWAPDAEHMFIVRVPRSDVAMRAGVRAARGVLSVRPVYRFQGRTAPVLSSGGISVRLAPGLTQFQRDQFFRDFRVESVRVIDPENSVYIVKPVNDPDADEVRTAAAMYLDDRTLLAHPDFIAAVAPKQAGQIDDEFFGLQWHLQNTGQSLGTPGADINVLDAWQSTFGEDVRLGIFDDCVDVQHEDLAGNYTAFGHDAVSGREGPLEPNPVGAFDAHGNAVMGLAVADINALGGRGVAPGARFTASRGLNDFPTFGQAASVYTFARQRDVDVHINSWGFVGLQNSQVDIIVDAIATSNETGRNNRGMVIVFASGNNGEQLDFDDDLATLPTVIGVGATNADDILAGYSNYGDDIDVMAPSGDAFLPGMFTTDVSDDAGFASTGYNQGDGTDLSGVPDVSNFKYTQNFSGTSAACPVAAGVAALVLSRNQDLTFEQARTILAQTAVKVNPSGAGYHPITERSLEYAYGRIDAAAAVVAAGQSADNGGFTWAEPVREARVSNNVLTWTVGDVIRMVDDDDNVDTPAVERGDSTFRTLLVESGMPFTATHFFRPIDGINYTIGQEVFSGITVVQNNQNTNFNLPGGSQLRYYAIFPANNVGRYAFGVAVDSAGNVIGIPGGGTDAGGGVVPTFDRPLVTIEVTPLSGVSPLQVRFHGNALSPVTVDTTQWDFDDGQVSAIPQVVHLYEVAPGETRRFFPSFTVTDEAGNSGSRTVAIDVQGAGGNIDAPDSAAQIAINISLPGSIGSSVDRGTSPFSVEFGVTGELASEDIESVLWDLGDGASADTISVPHTYINDTGVTQTLPVSVQVVTQSSTGLLNTQTATRFITVDPAPTDGTPDNDNGNGNGNGNSNGNGNDNGGSDGPLVNSCANGMAFALMSSFVGLTLLRRFCS